MKKGKRMARAPKTLENGSKYEKFDADGDGIISDEELKMAEDINRIEFERVLMENQDKREDAQRGMAWFALFGMLLYPFAVVLASWMGLEAAPGILGDMAPTYFVSVAAIIAAFYGTQAYTSKK
jgi:hypothetical protein